jgi:hypothetical protein
MALHDPVTSTMALPNRKEVLYYLGNPAMIPPLHKEEPNLLEMIDLPPPKEVFKYYL